jgi:hypothetical protein
MLIGFYSPPNDAPLALCVLGEQHTASVITYDGGYRRHYHERVADFLAQATEIA